MSDFNFSKLRCLDSLSQFLYYVLKQFLSGLELIRAHWCILYCLSMFN